MAAVPSIAAAGAIPAVDGIIDIRIGEAVILKDCRVGISAIAAQRIVRSCIVCHLEAVRQRGCPAYGAGDPVPTLQRCITHILMRGG